MLHSPSSLLERGPVRLSCCWWHCRCRPVVLCEPGALRKGRLPRSFCARSVPGVPSVPGPRGLGVLPTSGMGGPSCVWAHRRPRAEGTPGTSGSRSLMGSPPRATAHADGPERVPEGPEDAGLGREVGTHSASGGCCPWASPDAWPWGAGFACSSLSCLSQRDGGLYVNGGPDGT